MDYVFLLISFAINLVLSFVIADFAEKKGRSYWGFFWLSLLLSFLLALLLVVASPNQTSSSQESDPDEIIVRCPNCAEKILAEASVCKHCLRDVEPRKDLIALAAAEKTKKAIAESALKEQKLVQGKRENRIAAALSCIFIATFIFVLAIALSSGGENISIPAVLSGVVGVILTAVGISQFFKLPPKLGSTNLKT